ncbi:MAG: aspartate/glutamate racemase family protein [Euryarchaeota archaeon]|nr:aspartate/glutamate racemase family protein [Euryarchaeota archaeon]
MTGWRARLGVIVPSSNTAVEREFPPFASEGVSVHASRMPLESVTSDALDSMSDRAVDCGELLAHADVDAVAYACTTGSLLHGPGFDRELEEDLSAAVGGPAVATALSVDRALDALGAERIAVRTPYNKELNRREREYLEVAGYEVASIRGRGIEDNTAIGALTPENAYRQVSETVDPGKVDAVFVSCTNYRTLPVIEPLERDLGVPVVTSNGATLWNICRTVGVTVEAPGELFD